MMDPTKCPECSSTDSETVNVDWFGDVVERVFICNDCPTQWTVSYGDPALLDVEVYD